MTIYDFIRPTKKKAVWTFVVWIFILVLPVVPVQHNVYVLEVLIDGPLPEPKTSWVPLGVMGLGNIIDGLEYGSLRWYHMQQVLIGMGILLGTLLLAYLISCTIFTFIHKNQQQM